MGELEACDIRYSYQFAGNSITALSGLSMTIEKGEFVTVLGRNGSGKYTLVKYFNVLLENYETPLDKIPEMI